jgi:hypothetical protein
MNRLSLSAQMNDHDRRGRSGNDQVSDRGVEITEIQKVNVSGEIQGFTRFVNLPVFTLGRTGNVSIPIITQKSAIYQSYL